MVQNAAGEFRILLLTPNITLNFILNCIFILLYFNWNAWHFYQKVLSTGSVLKYLVLCLADASEEDEVSNEEADAEVQVNGGAGALDGADKPEGQYADEEAD